MRHMRVFKLRIWILEITSCNCFVCWAIPKSQRRPKTYIYNRYIRYDTIHDIDYYIYRIKYLILYYTIYTKLHYIRIYSKNVTRKNYNKNWMQKYIAKFLYSRYIYTLLCYIEYYLYKIRYATYNRYIRCDMLKKRRYLLYLEC